MTQPQNQSQVNPYVAEIFKLAHTLAPPLVDKLAGRTKNDRAEREGDALARIIRDNSLNGSGPADPRIAERSAPRTLLDQVFSTASGQQTEPEEERESGDPNQQLLLWVGLIGLTAILIFRRR